MNNSADSTLKPNIRAYISVLGGVLIQFTLGFTVIWGNINIYAASYMKGLGADIPSMRFYLIFPICAATSMQVGVALFNKISARILLMTAASVFSGSYMCCAMSSTYP